jgi:hypothetical protein
VVVVLFGSKAIDKKVRKQYPAKAVPVPASQALLNLVGSVFGEPGISLGFFNHVVGLDKRVNGVRVVASKMFMDVTYMTALATRRYLRFGFRIKHHVTPACNDFLTVNGVMLLDRAYSWTSPVVIVAQYPTKVLWTRYEPVDSLTGKSLKYKASKNPSTAYLPGITLVDAVFKAVPRAEYPFMFSACSEPDKKIDECTREGLLIVMDEHVSTLVYAVNMGVLKPEVREESQPANTPEFDLKTG